MEGITIRRAGAEDAHIAGALAAALWPSHTAEEMAEEMRGLLASEEAAVFLAEWSGIAVGFAQCQLRHDYVEGCEYSPAGYLEGVYVAEGFRRRGVAAHMLQACQEWAMRQGCREFASDCELDNQDSLRFHLGSGFEEAGRIICFVKRL